MLNQRAKLFPSRKAIIMHAQKSDQICNRLQIIRFFQFATEFFPAAF